jgi:hypothetical protein
MGVSGFIHLGAILVNFKFEGCVGRARDVGVGRARFARALRHRNVARSVSRCVPPFSTLISSCSGFDLIVKLHLFLI